MRTKFLALAAGAALIAGTGMASAATVENDLNLRAGPGTNYQVIDTMPAGAHVNIRNCTGSWCRVSFRGESGWASASYLGGGGRSTTVYRRSYVEPSYAYEPAPPAYYDYGPYAYQPGFSVGIGFGGFGGGWHGGHHGWHGGHHWHH